jgi:hypothetical protein
MRWFDRSGGSLKKWWFSSTLAHVWGFVEQTSSRSSLSQIFLQSLRTRLQVNVQLVAPQLTPVSQRSFTTSARTFATAPRSRVFDCPTHNLGYRQGPCVPLWVFYIILKHTYEIELHFPEKTLRQIKIQFIRHAVTDKSIQLACTFH